MPFGKDNNDNDGNDVALPPQLAAILLSGIVTTKAQLDQLEKFVNEASDVTQQLVDTVVSLKDKVATPK